MSTGVAPGDIPVLKIDDLTVSYAEPDGNVANAVENLDLTVRPGEIHALVGESGAGKSTVGNALMGLLQAPGRIVGGSITIDGRPFDSGSGRATGIVQGKDIGAVFQDPMTSLNPLFTVESQLSETMRFHLGIGHREARARALDLLKAVGIPEPERRLKAYPHQLSGGQRQRVVIAAALCCNPRLIVADEPTTALDVSVQAQILKLVRQLVDERKVGVLLITHNMGVVAEIADHVTIMKDGRAVESGRVAEVLNAPKHPYARALIGAVPRLDVTVKRLPVSSVEPEYTKAAREAVRERMSRRSASRVSAKALEVENLRIEYGARAWLPGGKATSFVAVDDVSFSVEPGEIFGIVGESGCGKTTLANAIAGLITPSSGTINIDGNRVGSRRDRRLRQILQMVFQDPYSALNPRLRIGTALAEPVQLHRLAANGADAAEEAALLLEAVGLERTAGARFPHAFSGGQRQRIAIARALSPRPQVLVCDEPTSSLDVSVQAQILNLLKDLRDLAGLSILFISHDLAVVRQMCDRIAVMKGGKIIELADTETLFSAPQQDYTRELLSLVPTLSSSASRTMQA
jgi:peptide/nickel transport system ATP-binding protein